MRYTLVMKLTSGLTLNLYTEPAIFSGTGLALARLLAIPDQDAILGIGQYNASITAMLENADGLLTGYASAMIGAKSSLYRGSVLIFDGICVDADGGQQLSVTIER